MPEVDENAREVAEAFRIVLKQCRKDANLSQEQTADIAGIGRKHYQALEAGYSSYGTKAPANPTLMHLRGLAIAFDISVPDLMHRVFNVEFDPQANE